MVSAMPVFLIFLLSIASLILLSPDAAPPPPEPQVAPSAHAAVGPLFETADRCMACHNGVALTSGEDVSIGFDWRASMMANAARDPYWQAAVRREVTDHPQAREAIEDKCSTCHMPMARYEAHLGGGVGEVFANLPIGSVDGRSAGLAADGVSCSACHQIQSDGLGDPSTFTGGFSVDEATPWGERSMLGPFETDRGRAAIMQSATGFIPREAPHIQSSELCASCHTLYTHPMDDEGNVVGELPEQVPYLEWLESDFAGPDGRSCQSCHMPVIEEPVPVTGVLGQPRDSVNRHVFRGGNFFMLGMLNRHRNELGVTALPQELDAAVRRTVEHLQTQSATVAVEPVSMEGGTLEVDVAVENLGGHKLPTAYPSRRTWLHVQVLDRDGALLWESGALEPSGAIVGNDADADGSRFEPHYDVVETPDQVQIYEPVMVDWEGRVTTGLLYGARYVKDNRLLPRGFEKGASHADVAVHGAAVDDADFVGGSDRVRYRVRVPEGASGFEVVAELRYQPIGYRWARNLGGYDAAETQRFVTWYDEMSEGSAVTLAAGRTRIER
jgi:hypothetical protein